MQERRRVIIVRDAEIILDHIPGLERTRRESRRVVLVIAEQTVEDQRQGRPVCVGCPLEEETATGLQLVSGVPRALKLVAAEDGDGRSRDDRADRVAHARPSAWFEVAGDVPRIAEVRHMYMIHAV